MSNQKFLAGLLIGAAAGAAITVFLHSKKGQALLASAKEKAEDWGDEIQDKLSDIDDNINDLVDKGKSFFAEAKKKADKTSNA